MSVDTVLDRSRNVRDMRELTHIPRVDFNPFRDLSDQDFQIMQHILNDTKQSYGYKVSAYIEYFSILGKNYDINTKSKENLTYSASLYNDEIAGIYPDALGLLSSSVFLRNFTDNKLSINPQIMEKIKNKFEENKVKDVFRSYAFYLMIDNNRDLELDEKIWQTALNNIDLLKEGNRWIINLAYLKLIFGDRINSLNYKINWDKEIEDLNELLSVSNWNNENVQKGIQKVFALSVLASDEAKITPEGFKISFKDDKNYIPSSPTIPEIERFET